MSNISVVGSKDGPAVDERELGDWVDARGSGLYATPATVAAAVAPKLDTAALDTAVTAKAATPGTALNGQLTATYAPVTGSPNYDAAGEALVNALIFGGN